MMQELKYLSGQLFYLQAPLDRDSWLDNKEDMDFTENPPEVQEMDPDVPTDFFSEYIILFRYIAIAILAALLVFLIVRLVSRRKTKSEQKDGNTVEVELPEESPNALSPIETLWAAYKKAKEEMNFREAIRVLHQIVINYLDSKGKLKAAPDKTNREYTLEISWQEKAQDFFRLTLLHEFTWYGAKEMNQFDFERAEPRFLEFIESIKNG